MLAFLHPSFALSPKKLSRLQSIFRVGLSEGRGLSLLGLLLD